MIWIKRDHKLVSEWVTSAFHTVMSLGGGSAPYSCGILDKPNFSQPPFITWKMSYPSSSAASTSPTAFQGWLRMKWSDMWKALGSNRHTEHSLNVNYWYCDAFVQFSSIQSCLTLCNSMDCSAPDFPVHYQLPELAQIHVHQVGDAIQLSHLLLSPSPPALNLSQHQGLSSESAKIWELQHQSFQWVFRVDFL